MNRARSYLLALCVGLSSPGLVPSVAPARTIARPADPVSTWQQSEYGLCDARALASMWGLSTWEGKKAIGNKLLSGWIDEAKLVVEQARQLATQRDDPKCSVLDDGFSRGDVRAVSQAWGLGEAHARQQLDHKLRAWGRATVAEAVRWAQEQQAGQAGGARLLTESAAAEAFFASTHSSCDAQLLAGLWGTDLWQTKVAIGRKLLTGSAGLGPALKQAEARAAQHPVQCWWGDSGLAYDDLERLARHWGMNNSQAKAAVGRKLGSGGRAALNEVVEGLRKQEGAGSLAASRAWAESRYGLCDARALATHWGTTAEQSKALAGEKLRAGNATTLASALSAAWKRVADNGGLACAFHESRYDYEDAARLAEAWGTSAAEAKAALEQKLSAGRIDLCQALIGR